MKNITSGKYRASTSLGDIHRAERSLRRDLSIRNEEKLPDLKSACNMAEQLEILERYIAKAPAIDPQLRSTMRNAIATGSYVIDPGAIAEKFLKFEDALYS